MLALVNQVAVDLGLERILDLANGTAERNLVMIASDTLHRKTLGCQPGGDLRKIILGHAKTAGVLLRSEPLVVLRRGRVLLLAKESVKLGLLGGRKPESQRQMAE